MLTSNFPSSSACDSLFGSAPESLTWLEGNLPSQAIPGAQIESEKLKNIKEEVAMLSAELKSEVDTNSKLQKDLTAGRKQNDEICAMLTMIRSETEAVIHRHNQIIVANEGLADEDMEDLDDIDNGDEEGEIEEDEEGTVVAEDDDGQDGFGAAVNLTKYGGNYDASDEDNVDEQPVREVIVPVPTQNGESAGINKRGYAGALELVDPDKKRRKV